MQLALHTYILRNGLPYEKDELLNGIPAGTIAIYEIIRLMDGVPLFLEDHFRRLRRSARIIGRSPVWTIGDVEISIRRLVKANQVRTGNVKVYLEWENDGKGVLYVYFVPHAYPSPEQYEQGVPVGLLHKERLNPNAKIDHMEVRDLANRQIRETGVYEVLLVDQEGNISEGSRSNVFAIRGREVITPPTADVLPGITREKIISSCRTKGIPILEERIPHSDLPHLDGLFLSGTSPGVLPISSVDTLRFSPRHPLIRQIADNYHHLVREYLHSYEVKEVHS